MRAINKRGAGPFQLTNSNTSPPATSEVATRRWSRFGYKSQVLDHLVEEQYGLCCYSEIRPDQIGLSFHIEHVENKGQHPQRTFSYDNLAACALDSGNDLKKFKAQGTEAFGGHALGKSKGVEMARFVSCHQGDCSRFFTYLSDGRVVPADGLLPLDVGRAQYTIELLNLNSHFLQELRLRWWEELEEIYEEHVDGDMDLHCLAGVDLIPIGSKLSQFFSITRDFFGGIAEEVIAREAPYLK